jgi:hypothetical protein
MSYIVEILNDSEDWIRKSYHNNRDNADIVFDVQVEAGWRARIVHDGKIIREG